MDDKFYMIAIAGYKRYSSDEVQKILNFYLYFAIVFTTLLWKRGKRNL